MQNYEKKAARMIQTAFSFYILLVQKKRYLLSTTLALM